MCPSGRVEDRRDHTLRNPISVGGLRSAFDALDADHDGKISAEDLKSLSVVSDVDIEPMIAAADSDRNGYVDFYEFESVLTNGRRNGASRNGSLMMDVFRAMDRDGDGEVGFEDLKAYLGSAGIMIGDDEVRAMIRVGGGDENDGVCFDNLLKILAVD